MTHAHHEPDAQSVQASFVSHTPHEIVSVCPFEEDGHYTTEIDREINVGQLAAELEEASGHAVQVALLSADPGPISPESKGILYITPKVDGRTVHAVLRKHVIDPDFGYTPQQRERRRLLEKIESGDPLTPEEVTQTLKVALQRP